MTQLEIGLSIIEDAVKSATYQRRSQPDVESGKFFQKILRKIQGKIKYEYFTFTDLPPTIYMSIMNINEKSLLCVVAIEKKSITAGWFTHPSIIFIDFTDEEIDKKIAEIKMMQVLDR